MRECLFSLFSRFGLVLKVSAKRNVMMRGQAFVAFQNPLQAQEAFKTMNNAPFFGKLMEIQWAKRDSDITLSPALAQKKKDNRKRVITKNYFQSTKFKDRMNKKKALRNQEMESLNINILDKMLDSGQTQVKKEVQVPIPSKKPPQKPLNEPHFMLILEKLPDIPTEQLKALFSGLEGFKEIRHIGKRRVALVDFEDSSTASTALEAVKSHVFEGGEEIHINFGKK